MDQAPEIGAARRGERPGGESRRGSHGQADVCHEAQDEKEPFKDNLHGGRFVVPFGEGGSVPLQFTEDASGIIEGSRWSGNAANGAAQ